MTRPNGKKSAIPLASERAKIEKKNTEREREYNGKNIHKKQVK